MSIVVDKNVADVLLKEVKELKLSYAMLRMDVGAGKLIDTSRLRKIRFDIARKFTYLHQLGAWEVHQKKNNSGSIVKKN